MLCKNKCVGYESKFYFNANVSRYVQTHSSKTGFGCYLVPSYVITYPTDHS